MRLYFLKPLHSRLFVANIQKDVLAAEPIRETIVQKPCLTPRVLVAVVDKHSQRGTRVRIPPVVVARRRLHDARSLPFGQSYNCRMRQYLDINRSSVHQHGQTGSLMITEEGPPSKLPVGAVPLCRGRSNLALRQRGLSARPT
jgi:hypothetical protein